jgi:predicted nucleic acid-binding protein
LVSERQVKGAQVHDARLVATMLAYGITYLLTLNEVDFRRYPEIRVLTPASVSSWE